VELFYVSIVTECVCPPSCVLQNISFSTERGNVQSTCNCLREDEGAPIPFSVRGDVLSLLPRELMTLNRLLQAVVVGNVGGHKGRRWN
jgi:hypothetical protein